MHFVDKKCCFTVYCFIFRGYMWEMTYKPQLTILKTFFISYTVHNIPILCMCFVYHDYFSNGVAQCKRF